MSYRRYVVLAASLFTMVAVTSEASAQGPVLGAKLGASWSNFKADPDDGVDQSQLTSFAGGGFLRFDLGRIGVQPELMVVTKGSRAEDSDDAGEVKMKLDYIEVPLLLYVPLMQSSVTPYLIGGPAVGFEIGCKVEAEFGTVGVSADCDDGEAEGEDFLGDRKKVDFGAIAGAGLSIPMGPGSALIEGRYTFGLSKIVDSVDGNVKNRSLGVMVGYSIPLGR